MDNIHTIHVVVPFRLADPVSIDGKKKRGRPKTSSVSSKPKVVKKGLSEEEIKVFRRWFKNQCIAENYY